MVEKPVTNNLQEKIDEGLIMKKYFVNVYLRATTIFVIVLFVALLFKKIYLYIDSYFPVPEPNFLDPDFNDAAKFIQHGYPEIKSLSFQFLTLLTAILIFSLTFSEKIVNYTQSTTTIRAILITGWTFLIAAIISDGIGLAYNAVALPYALSDLHEYNVKHTLSAEFYEPALNSVKLILLSGTFFIAGLICIVAAGIASLIKR